MRFLFVDFESFRASSPLSLVSLMSSTRRSSRCAEQKNSGLKKGRSCSCSGTWGAGSESWHSIFSSSRLRICFLIAFAVIYSLDSYPDNHFAIFGFEP